MYREGMNVSELRAELTRVQKRMALDSARVTFLKNEIASRATEWQQHYANAARFGSERPDAIADVLTFGEVIQ